MSSNDQEFFQGLYLALTSALFCVHAQRLFSPREMHMVCLESAAHFVRGRAHSVGHCLTSRDSLLSALS